MLLAVPSAVFSQGPQGPPGPQGAPGIGTQGPQGASGIGTQGPQGAPGIGTQGPQGAQGPSGGPQGPQGFQGAVGGTGSQGPQGFQGAVGGTGSQGPQGFQGAAGSTGGQGPQGFQGLTGSSGSQGPQGFQGAVGSTGSQGPQGFQGDVGATGSQGPQGFQGNVGSTGTQGPQGASGGGAPQVFNGVYTLPDVTWTALVNSTDEARVAKDPTAVTGLLSLGRIIVQNSAATDVLNLRIAGFDPSVSPFQPTIINGTTPAFGVGGNFEVLFYSMSVQVNAVQLVLRRQGVPGGDATFPINTIVAGPTATGGTTGLPFNIPF